MRSRLASLLLLTVLSGCTVGLGELSPSELAVNECDDDSACHGGHCQDHVCQATEGDLSSLLVTVVPSGTAPGAASVTYYADFPAQGKTLDDPLDIEVPAPVVLGLTDDQGGTVSIELDKGCRPSFYVSEDEPSLMASEAGLIPANVTFTSTRGVPGVPADKYRSNLAAGRFAFQANVPPGDYDVYIEPAFPLSPSNTCLQVPPRLFLNQPVTKGLNFKLPSALTLTVSIEWPLRLGPADENLDPDMLRGWTVDLVEPALGRAISTPTVLEEPAEMGGGAWTYTADILYAPIYEHGKPKDIANELIRLTPPEGVAAPILYAVVGNAQPLNPDDADVAGIVLASPLPTPVDVEFQTTLAGQPIPVPANVALTARDLDGVFGLATGFSRTVDIGMDGLATLSLLPGHYRVVATPKAPCTSDSCLATVEAEWVVAAEPATQAGKTLEFGESPRIEGHAYVASEAPAVGATVRAVASPLIVDNSVLNVADARAPVQPRATLGLVESGGDFSFEADSGVYTLRIEPEPSTGFGWMVMPELMVPTGVTLRLDLPLPVQHRGRVTLQSQPDFPVPGATVRAFVYYKDGLVLAKYVEGAAGIQVAETQTDDDGNYVLLIPRLLGVDQ